MAHIIQFDKIDRRHPMLQLCERVVRENKLKTLERTNGPKA